MTPLRETRSPHLHILVASICLWCFGVSQPIPYQTATLLLLTAAWLWNGNYKTKLRRTVSTSWRKLLFVPMGFYALHLTGLFYTTNFQYAGLDLGIKLPMLLVPFFLATLPSEAFTAKYIRFYLWAFVGGVLFYTSICSMRALVDIFIHDIPYNDTLFYINMSSMLHIAYLSMLCCVAMLILYFHGEQLFPKKRNGLRVMLFLYLAFFVVLLDSRAGVISLLIVLTSVFLHLMFFQKQYFRSLCFAFGFGILFVGIGILLPGFGERFQKSAQYVLAKIENKISVQHHHQDSEHSSQKTLDNLANYSAIQTFQERKHTVRNTNEVIKQNLLFGVGTGDFKQSLCDAYRSDTTFVFDENQYKNSHQQYLQTLATLGLLGLLSLLLLLLLPFIWTVKHRYWSAAIFLVFFAFNLSFESVLERQSGVYILCFAYALIFFCPKNHRAIHE